jgi:hypothetical protein
VPEGTLSCHNDSMHDFRWADHFSSFRGPMQVQQSVTYASYGYALLHPP